MPLRSLFLLWLVLALLAHPSRAQNAPPATPYLVTHAGDTLRGALQAPRFVTEYGVKFSGNATSPASRFLPVEARAFRTADGRRYRSRPVNFAAQQLVLRQATAAVTRRDSLPVFLQELVLGKATLYRLDYHLTADRAALEYTQYETTFFFVEVPGSALLRLEQQTFRATLKTLLADCPTVKPTLAKIPFSDAGLAQLVLEYNTACAAGFAAPVALPLASGGPIVDQTGFNKFGIRVGAALASAAYPNGQFGTQQTNSAQINLTAGLSFQVQPRRWGFATGLNFTARRNAKTVFHAVGPGFDNQGDILALEQTISVNSLSIPLLVQYASSARTSHLQPFIALGPVIGCNLGSASSQEELTSVARPGRFIPTQIVSRVDISTLTNQRFYPTIGGQVSAGMRLRTGSHALVLELLYENGREANGNFITGNLVFHSTGLRFGLDF